MQQEPTQDRDFDGLERGAVYLMTDPTRQPKHCPSRRVRRGSCTGPSHP
jgi:hypothetical protein